MKKLNDRKSFWRRSTCTLVIFWVSVIATLAILIPWWKESIFTAWIGVDLQMPSLGNILDFMYVLAASLFIIFSAWGWGRILLKRFFNLEKEHLTFIGGGLWFLSILSLLAGFIGLLNHVILIVFLLIPFFQISHFKIIAWRGRLLAGSFKSVSPGLSFLFVLIGIYFFYNFLSSYLPVHQSDGLRYHVAIPALFFQEGGIRYIPLNAFSNFPFTTEMIYIYSFALGRDVIIKFLHFYFFILSGLALWGMWREELSSKMWKMIAIAWFLSVPFFPVLATWSFNDFGWVFFLFLNLWHLKKFLSHREDKDLLLSMLFLGISFSAKYSVLLIIVIEALCLLMFYPRRCLGILKRYRMALLIIVLLAAPILPYLVKNIVYTGNPVYPLANEIFQGGEWGRFETEFYFSRTADKGIDTTFPNLFRVPFLLVRDWPLFESWNPGISFLFGFFALFVPFKGKFLNFYRLLLLLFFVGWFFTYQSNRFLIPLIMGIIPLACISYSRIKGSKLAAGIIAGTLVINLYSWLGTTWNSYNPLPFFTGQKSEHQFLEQNITYYPMAQYLNRRQEQVEGYVLFIGEHRRYYVEHPQVYVSDWFDPPYILYFIRKYEPEEIDEFLEILREKCQVEWIFYNQRELSIANNYHFFRKRFTDEEWEFYQNFLSFIEEGKRSVFHGLFLYDLKQISGQDL